MTRRLPGTLRIGGTFLICVACFALAGGHWAVLQTIAWAQMVRDYSKNVPVGAAIVRTLSGEYPCGMCTRISAARQEEEKTPAVLKVEKKAEICPLSMRELLRQPEVREYWYPRPGEFALVERREAPPAPVPIFTLIA